MQPLRGSPGKWYAVLTDKVALTSRKRKDYHIFLSNRMELTSKKAILLSTEWSLDHLDDIPIIRNSDDPHRRKTSQERMEGRENALMVSEPIEKAKAKAKARTKEKVREGGRRGEESGKGLVE